MKIYIDADGCPVVKITLAIAEKYGVSTIIIADTAHYFDIDSPLVETVIASKGIDSSDFAIISRCERGDIVITQDYALAAMCMAKGAYAINQNGRAYDNDNIDELLMRRHINKKIRQSGGRTPHTKKRVKALDEAFTTALERLISKLLLTNI